MEDGFITAVVEKMQADGITKKELADRCGYVEATVERVLEGNIPLKLETAATIAAALGMSLDAVCGIIVKQETKTETETEGNDGSENKDRVE